jgi:deazaflavin-dependent oxidoreductase (nitroreductase family)
MIMTKEAFTKQQVKRGKKVLRLVSSINAFIYRVSNGRLWSKWAGKYPIMVLSTMGRQTKKIRHIPLIKVLYKNQPLLVASMGGAPIHPSWFFNVQNNPNIEVQIGSEKKNYQAIRASEEEKESLWPTICSFYSDYQVYQERTQRNIPVFICTPIENETPQS